tara:strand:- start:1772 stop:2269 length:498 start_codon:yes stop_codon:yes gene_type:complete
MLAEYIDNINRKHIILNDPIKNSVLQHSNFYKLSYSNEIISFNGIYIIINLKNINYNEKQFRLEFNSENNNEIINKIKILEQDILNLLDIPNKEKQYKMSEIFRTNNLKYTLNELNNELINNHNFRYENLKNSLIIKISGIWETKEKFGITFKIISINKAINKLI